MTRLLAVGVLAAACAAASCARQASADRDIVIGLANSPTNLDPAVGNDEASQKILSDIGVRVVERR